MKLSILTLAVSTALMGISWPGMAAAQEPDGQALYNANCKVCHGAEGAPSPAMAKSLKVPAFADPAALQNVSEDSAVTFIDHGFGPMRGFKGRLTRKEEVALSRYIRTFGKKAENEDR